MGGSPAIVTWRGVTADPESALCWEAAATDPELEDMLIRPIPGFGSYRDNAASGGTDNGGGHVDINLVGYTDEQCRRAETVYRRYGNAAYWRPERRPDGTRYGWQNHLHVIRMDCGDLSSGARTQVQDYLLGWNGLPIGGRITRDTGSRDYTSRRWLAIKNQEADMQFTDKIPGSNLTVQQVLNRANWAYMQIIDGGSIDNRIDAATAGLVELRAALAANDQAQAQAILDRIEVSLAVKPEA